MSQNLSFDPSVDTTYKDILSNNTINWGLFSYSGDVLKTKESGDGGLEELIDEFSDGLIQYAFVKVIDPQSQLPKYVLISWCGEGVPISRKGLFNYHVNTVAHFFEVLYM